MPQSHTRRTGGLDSDSISEAIQSGAQSVAEAGSDIYNAAIDQANQTSKQVKRYVNQNPWYAIGIAAGAGLLVGLMLRRR